MRHSLRRCLPRSSTKRVVLAAVGLLGLIVGLAAVTNAFTQRSTKSDETALAARSDLVYAERAVTRYWRERVALNEHLLSPSAPLRSEMTPYELAFERALGRVGATTPREHVLVASALVADDAMISAFARYESDVRAGAALRGANYQASLVVHRLAKLAALNETEADSATVQAASARALARNFRILTLLLIAAAIVVSAAWAIRLFRRIADQNRELKALDALKDEFVASVSHELRTPLTSIRGYLALLREQGEGR